MKSPSLVRFWLAMILIAGVGTHWAGAAEKIQFSSGSKELKKNNLAIQPNKPALQTLDFNRMGGRGSKAEEMAPMLQPPQAEAVLPADKKKKDKDWQLYEDKDAKDTDAQDGKSGEQSDREKGKSNRNEPSPREKNDKPWSPYDRDRDDSDPKEDRFDPGFNRSGSTNRILFGSTTRPGEQPFRAERAPGSPVTDRGLPPGSGPNPLADTSRSETLRVLGIEKSPAGGPMQNGTSRPDSTGSLGIGDWDNNSSRRTANSPLDTLNTRPAGTAFDNSQNFGGRDTGFKSGLPGEMNPLNLGPAGRGPIGYEPPKYERKPAVLPIPQRKF
jgi:hypothetical protein